LDRRSDGTGERHQRQRGPAHLEGARASAAPLSQFKLSNDALGVEYYSDLGPFPNFVSLNEQQHNIYAVVDFKVGRFDVNAGVGYGLTPGSDLLMAKMIIGTDLTPGVTNRATDGARSLRKSDSFLPGCPDLSWQRDL
jgi:hypothetical protein